MFLTCVKMAIKVRQMVVSLHCTISYQYQLIQLFPNVIGGVMARAGIGVLDLLDCES